MNYYKILSIQVFSNKKLSVIPIHYEDRFAIINWRNEQIYHLRQNKPLTIEDQDNYFNNVVINIFVKCDPIKFYFLFLNRVCV